MVERDLGMCADLEERLRFETLIADLSSRFVNVRADAVDREIEETQRRVCECLDLDVCALWQSTRETPDVYTLTHVHNPAEPGTPDPRGMLAHEYFPWCLRQLLAGTLVVVPSVDSLPPEASRDQEIWRAYGCKTSLTFPLSAGGGRVFGFLSFNDRRRERNWQDSVVQRLQLVAEVFANALARRRADELLRESEERLSLAADSADAGLWSLDLATERYWLTEKTRELFGLAPDEVLTFEGFLAAVHPDDREAIRETVRTVVESKHEGRIDYRVIGPDGGVRWVSSRGRVRSGGVPERPCLMGVSLDITERKEAEAALHDLSARLITAREQERAWLAKELHDGLSQQLALLAVDLDLAGQRPPETPREFTTSIEKMSAQVRALSADVHRLSHGLHPAKLEYLGLPSALAEFCRELHRTAGLSVRFTARDVPPSLADDVALCLYRVAQEALQNVVKHSGAENAAVELLGSPSEILLRIVDDGKGFHASSKPARMSLGLIGMRERVRIVRGAISFESSPGRGTVVSARVPLKGDAVGSARTEPPSAAVSKELDGDQPGKTVA